MVGMAIALVATIRSWPLDRRPCRPTDDRRSLPVTLVLILVADGDRRRDRRVAGPHGRDDRDARADRDAAQLRRPGRRAGRLQLLPRARAGRRGAMATIHAVEVFLGVFIGAVTFTGSIVAYLKLSAKMKSAPLVLPGRHLLNLAIILVSFALMIWFVIDDATLTGDLERASSRSSIMTVLALLLGFHLVAAIGGGDMPVVVSMLNSYSGWAAAAAGLHAQQRPADHHRLPGRLLRCDPELHHVQGDEPVVHLGDRRRLRLRRRPSTGEARDYGEHREINADGGRRAAGRRPVGGHHPRLRHGRRPGAVPGRGAHLEAAGAGASPSASASTPSPAACPGT